MSFNTLHESLFGAVMSIRRAIYNKYKTCFDYLYTGSSVQYEQYDSINVNDSGEIASFLFGLAFFH